MDPNEEGQKTKTVNQIMHKQMGQEIWPHNISFQTSLICNDKFYKRYLI